VNPFQRLTDLLRRFDVSDPTVTYTHEDVVALAALMEASIGASSADRAALADLAAAQKQAAAELLAVQQRNEQSVGAAQAMSADRRTAAVQAEVAVTAKLQAMGLRTTVSVTSARAERHAESYAPRAE
jgi:hypothetical protein